MVSPSSLIFLTLQTLTVTLMSRVAFCCPRKVSIDDVYQAGQTVMGRAGQWLSVMHPGSPKDKRFRGYFGVFAEVAVEAWEMMVELITFLCLMISSLFVGAGVHAIVSYR